MKNFGGGVVGEKKKGRPLTNEISFCSQENKESGARQPIHMGRVQVFYQKVPIPEISRTREDDDRIGKDWAGKWTA